uniref:VLIG-type G domain-containing protein n=1 Tax=Takifugu rubripes TaxID=31033 RepID=A0A674MQC0_TAKRU
MSSSDEVAAELTLVLVGDTNSMKTGSQNILFDHDKQANVEQISEGLYDLCGRHISVINLLGHQNSETCQLNKGVHAFILLVSNSHHESSYRAGRQWLEKAFGEESLPYLLTVVTHESDEQCKSALTNLKGDDSFNDKRYHTCKKGMTDQREMVTLLEKVDVMVQENNPSCYTRPKCEGAHEEDKIKSSEFQGNQQGGDPLVLLDLWDSKIKMSSSDEVAAELTLVLVGDTNSMKTGSQNILFDHDMEQISEGLYDLCGRHISVINLLGHQNSETCQLNKGVYAFILLVSNSHHESSYRAGRQWLEKAFGEESLPYLLTVVTHESDEQCKSALTNLKRDDSFNDKRYHTCKKGMTDETEILALLEKVDVMVQENNPSCYTRPKCEGAHEEDKIKSSEYQGNQQGGDPLVLLDLWDSKIKMSSSDEVAAELTLVLVGDTNSMKTGSQNILFDHDMEQISEGLYDLCGRHISVINLLGHQNSETCQLNKGVHAFILLVSNSHHESSYRAGRQWLEKAFGEESLPYLLTVVTHESDEQCKSALTNLKRDDSFNDKRYHTCKNGMPDETEILALLEKVDVMVQENNPSCYTRPKCEGAHEEDKIKSSEFQGNQQDSLHPAMDETRRKQLLKSPDESTMKTPEAEFSSLLGRLCLQDKYRQKLTPADFLKIRPPLKQEPGTCEKDVVLMFSQKLMLLDYTARYIPITQDDPDPGQSDLVPQSSTVEAEKDVFAAFLCVPDSSESKQQSVHPMDIQMALFHCSDSFLKQNLITKLSQCQYALPLLVPDPVTMDIQCPLWTFRQIKKTWKTTGNQDNSNTVTLKTVPICNAKTPMVSFFRLGSLSLSKSQLINNLISSRHNTFYHRDCQGSTKTRHLMEGVAEIAWYCPAGKSNDAFTDCTAFCNLHGDARLLEKQHSILSEKSSVTVVLISARSESDRKFIEDLMKSTKPLILLIVEEKSNTVQFTKGKYSIGLKDRGQSNVSEELKRIIQNILAGPHDSFQLESMATVSGIRLDEEDEACQKGKAAAEKVMDLIKGHDVSAIKEKFLTCQGETWQKWCDTNKKQYRLKDQAEMDKSQKQQELKEIRKKQCRNFCELVNVFVEGISSLTPSEKEYFLKWIQLFIDDLTTENVSSILQNYDGTWSEVLMLKEKTEQSDQLRAKQQELEQISEKLHKATFGLEHIYREMGQIYEAHASLQKQPLTGQTDWSQYPELAAELMISGHPIELMDGDAGHVPITWIPRLLEEVIQKLGDKRVFVLSVLGIQSSGKSTMLNAMFGLQFAVSAGRCTKGAFMQLLKVSDEMRDLLKFDYVLVVDTEGLRALELAGHSTLHRDNELATFVVGLGNMTLINVFGENPSEMQDVLEIVIQAFMRMKVVKLSPSCVFVHQNVADVAAAEKNMEGRRRLQEKLDKMVQLAAEEEVYDAQSFSRVISFNVQEDVKYFAQLWEGSPPMAPPNPGYSESIQDLKNFIISRASQSTGITLSQFKSKVQDLWNALLNENFVFSFKNTYEISVYRKLEVAYGNWTWTLRNKMLDVENQLYVKIENGTVDKISDHDLHNQLNEAWEKITKSMTDYFDKDGDSEVLAQWRSRFGTKIKEFLDGMVEQVAKKLNAVIQQKEACKKLDERKTELEKNLLQKSKELAVKLKDKNKKKLQKHFNSLWTEWISELTAHIKPIANINIADDVTVVLMELGFEWKMIHQKKTSGSYKQIPEAGNYSCYVTRKHNNQDKRQVTKFVQKSYEWVKQCISGGLSNEEQKLIRDLISAVEEEALTTIQAKQVAITGYNITYLHEVGKNVIKAVEAFHSGKKFTLNKEFSIELVLYVCDRLKSWLEDSHKKFKHNNDVYIYAESKKPQFFKAFKAFCKDSSSSVVFGGLICDQLKGSTIEASCIDSATNLADEMICNHPVFNGNRRNLEKHMMKLLAEDEDFDGFMTYIHTPKKYMKTFIGKEVEKYIKVKRDKVQNILRRNVENITKLLIKALHDATKAVKAQRGNIEMWVKEFSRLTEHKVKLSISCEGFSDIDNFDFLEEQIKKGLESNKEMMGDLSPDDIKKYRLQPDQILIDQLCNCCWVTCPFCSAVCTNTVKDHSPDKHSAPFHRPNGVNGRRFRGTNNFVVESCTTLVASDRAFYPHHDSDVTIPYKQYQTAGEECASWEITSDGSLLPFWKWFNYRFQKELENHYDLRFTGEGEIPNNWGEIKKEDAIKSLDEL